MMRKGINTVLFALLALTLIVSSASAAASGDGAVRVATVDTNFYGIQGKFTVPSDVFVADHLTDPDKHGYIAFYLGLDNICEGGISYTPSVGWKKFLNCGPNTDTTTSNVSMALSNQPSAGTEYTVKLVNNLDNTASLYINGYLMYTLQVSSDRTLTAPTYVKMVHSTYDPQDLNRYKDAIWSNVTVKNQNGSYTSFPSEIRSDIYPWGKGDYSVPSLNPLHTSLLADS
jgi:hypothetical protein